MSDSKMNELLCVRFGKGKPQHTKMEESVALNRSCNSRLNFILHIHYAELLVNPLAGAAIHGFTTSGQRDIVL